MKKLMFLLIFTTQIFSMTTPCTPASYSPSYSQRSPHKLQHNFIKRRSLLTPSQRDSLESLHSTTGSRVEHGLILEVIDKLRRSLPKKESPSIERIKLKRNHSQ